MIYHRFKGDVQLEQDSKYRWDIKPMRGEYAITLFIEDCQVEDEGIIKCVAKNPAGEAENSAKLEVSGTL